MRRSVVAMVLAGLLPFAMGGCSDGAAVGDNAQDGAQQRVTLSIVTPQGEHRFQVEVADTAEEQARGLMYRTDIPENGGMLFAPYPPEGGPAREASFWMENTPTPLDILFIRADGTIARIAENTIPYSREPIPSGEPIAAVLELVGGRTAELGISEGDRVRWPGGPG